MKTRIKMSVVFALVLAILVFVGIMTYLNRADQSGRVLVREITSSTHPVQTVVVTPLDLVERLSSTGVLQAERDVIISSEVAGKVEKVFRKLGDKCQKGALLARLDAEGYQINLAQAEAAVRQGEVALDHARRDLERMTALKESAVATAQQLDAAEGATSTSLAALEQARAAQKMAARNLREAGIRCPFTGFVADIRIDTGSAVMPQTPVARLVDTSHLKLVLSVTSAEMSRIQSGQQAIITDPSVPDEMYRGTVSRLGVAADSTTRTFPVEVSVSPTGNGLKAGQVVHVSLELQVHKDVIALPNQAILTDPVNGKKYVLAVKNGVVEKVEVVTGLQIEDSVIVKDGLGKGTEVVTIGGDELEDGMAVDVTKRYRQKDVDGGIDSVNKGVSEETTKLAR